MRSFTNHHLIGCSHGYKPCWSKPCPPQNPQPDCSILCTPPSITPTVNGIAVSLMASKHWTETSLHNNMRSNWSCIMVIAVVAACHLSHHCATSSATRYKQPFSHSTLEKSASTTQRSQPLQRTQLVHYLQLLSLKHHNSCPETQTNQLSIRPIQPNHF